MTHIFDTGVHLTPVGEGAVCGHTHPQWANMVGPFGGVTAATMLRAIEEHPDRHGDPIALTVNFLAPIADGDFTITARSVRTNRSNQHWIVELAQDGDVKTTATAVFGLRRDTFSGADAVSPSVAAPENFVQQQLPGPVWLANYDMRYVDGAIPDGDSAPSTSSATTLWVRDEPARALDFAGLTAFSDIFYPRVFLRLGHPVPAGTISMTVYYHADRDALAGHRDDFVLATAHAQRFSRGYFDQSAQIWDRAGTLLATTHQIVYFKS